jgi:hypothetical protein
MVSDGTTNHQNGIWVKNVEIEVTKQKSIKKRSLIARLLSSPLFRLRKLPNKKKYNRKKQSRIIW